MRIQAAGLLSIFPFLWSPIRNSCYCVVVTIYTDNPTTSVDSDIQPLFSRICFTKHKNEFLLPIISQHWDDKNSWNPSSWKNPFTQRSQCHGCWWPGDTRSHGISSHCFDQILQEYSSLSTKVITSIIKLMCGNGWIISPHTLLGMWIHIHAGTKVNPC